MEPSTPATKKSAPQSGVEAEGVDAFGPDKPILLVVSDTEEEFDWSKPFDRANTAVTAMSQIHKLQEMAEEFKLAPTYVIDYPVASQSDGYEPLLRLLESGRCEIGAHLHPWVNPPFDEEVTRFNSFAGNLPRDLEQAKLAELCQVIQENLAVEPRVYKAGRYGIGSNTDQILADSGIEVDLSPMPPFDFSEEGGPDFSDGQLNPSLPLGEGGFLRIPQTGAYVGSASSLGGWVYPRVSAKLMTSFRVPGILSKLRLIDRLVLSPEGYSLRELKRVTQELLLAGVRLFCFSFHSPSLEVGCTPYVNSESELEEFLETCRSYFDFFTTDIGGVGMTASEARTHFMRTMYREGQQ